MEVGQLTSDQTSFDLDNLDETNSVITRTTTAEGGKRIRWLYKDEELRLVTLEKTDTPPTAFPRGAPLVISAIPGYAEPAHPRTTSKPVARLAIPIDFANPSPGLRTQVVTDALGVSHTAILVPVVLG